MRVNNKMTYRFDQEGNRYEQAYLPNAKPDLKLVDKEVHTSQTIEETIGEDESISREMLYGLDTEQLEQLIRGTDDQEANSQWERQQYERDEHERPQQARSERQVTNGKELGTDEPSVQKLNSEDTLIDIEDENSVLFIERKASSNTDYYADQFNSAEAEGLTRSRRSVARTEGPSWGNVFIAVCSALATGVVIGYMILTLMFGQKIWPTEQMFANQHTKEQLNEHSPIVQPEQSNLKASSTSTVTITPLEYKYHLLQHGVFNQENTRDEAIALLKQKGYPSAFIAGKDEKYYLYTGIATSADHALPISEQLASIETYRKEITLTLPQKLEYSGSASALELYIQSTNRLINMFADITTVQFEQTSFSPLGAVTEQAWAEQFKQWEEQAAAAYEGFADTNSDESVTAINESLQQAKQHLSAYQQKPSAKEMWQVQSAALQAVLLQKEWIEQLNTLS